MFRCQSKGYASVTFTIECRKLFTACETLACIVKCCSLIVLANGKVLKCVLCRPWRFITVGPVEILLTHTTKLLPYPILFYLFGFYRGISLKHQVKFSGVYEMHLNVVLANLFRPQCVYTTLSFTDLPTLLTANACECYICTAHWWFNEWPWHSHMPQTKSNVQFIRSYV